MAPQKRPRQNPKEFSASPSKRQNTNSKGRPPVAKLTCQPRATNAKKTTAKKGASTKHPIEIKEDEEDTELTEKEEESNGIFRHMPPPPPPHRCDIFPYFNNGAVFIIIDSHDAKYQYRLHKCVLERCAPRLSDFLGRKVNEFDQLLRDSNPSYKHGTRLELVQHREKKWELLNTSFTMAKPPTPIKTIGTASVDSETSIFLSNAKTMKDAFELSAHSDQSYRPSTFKEVHQNEPKVSPQLNNSPKSPQMSHFNGLQEVSGTSSNETGPKDSDMTARHENESATYAVIGTTIADELLSQNNSQEIFGPSNLEAISNPVPVVPPAFIENSKNGRQHDLGDLEVSNRSLENEVMASIGPFQISSSSGQSPRQQTDSNGHVLCNENQAERYLQITLPAKDNGSTEVTALTIPTKSIEDYTSNQKISAMIKDELDERIPPCKDLAIEVAFSSVTEKKATSQPLINDLASSGAFPGIPAENTHPVSLFPSVCKRSGKTEVESLQQFREPERFGTVGTVDEKSNASITSKLEIPLAQTNLENSEHYQGLAISATGPSGATMLFCDLASQVGSSITDPCSDPESCAHTLSLSTSVAEADGDHHEQESMKQDTLSSSLDASDGLAKKFQHALVSTHAKNVTNINFDGPSDDRLDIIEDKEGCFSHRNANNDGNPPRDLCETYNNIFSIFYHISPKIDTSDIEVALKQSELIMRRSAALGCSCVVRPYICSALFQFGQDLFKAVHSQAPRLLRLGISLESAPIVREAIIHLVGNFSSLKEADINTLKTLGSQTMGLITYKRIQLKLLCTEVNNTLFMSTIHVNENPIQISSISKNSFDTWVVVQLWHDYFCQSMASFDHEPQNIGTLYRQLLKGGEAYLPLEKLRKTLESMDLSTVTSERILHNKILSHLGSTQFSALVDAPVPNQFHGTATKENSAKPGTFRDLALDLMLMKDFAKHTVKEICVNNSSLDVEEMGIEYLTCTTIDDSELPWVTAAEREADEMT